MTWVFPPEAYRRAGSEHPVWARPISMCAMQWLTPIIGTFRYPDSARAAVAAMRRQGPRPGPMEKETRSMSLGPIPALSRASEMTRETTSA